MEETKCLKPSDSASRIGDRASVQAATRVNAEQASIDGEVLGRDGLEIAAEAAVADERLVAPRLREGRLWASLARSPSRCWYAAHRARQSARLRRPASGGLPS
jgi:hypothetical protein